MRILFVSQYFHPEQFSNNSVAQQLVRRGHEVDVISCVPNYGRAGFFQGYSNKRGRTETWNGIRIFRARTIARGTSKLRLLLNYLAYPAMAITEYHSRRLKRPDVTFVSMPSPLTQALFAIYLKRRYGVPTVYWVQDIWPESPILTLGIRNPAVRKALDALCGWIYRQADTLLVQSPGFVDRITRFGVPAEKIGVFPNTAPAGYEPAAPTGQDSDSSPFRIMFAGNIGESQDFETIVEAAEVLREEDIHWTIVGSGRHETWVREAVEQRGLAERFTFEGRHPEEQMPRFFHQADAMLVSLKDTPIFELTVPYKVQCYLACGRPIIGSISGEAAKIIEQSGAGFAAPASKPGELAAAIRQMAALGKAEREEMGAAGRTFFEANYAAEKVYGMLEDWLVEAAERT